MTAPSSTNNEQRSLATPAQFLRGVGPQRAEKLARLNLRTAADLLFFFPRDYEQLGAPKSIGELEQDEAATVFGVVEEVDLRTTGPGRSVLGVLISDGVGHVRGVWFNQPFLQTRYRQGQRVLFTGKPKFRGVCWEINHPRVDFLAENEEPPDGQILPVYSLTEGVSQHHMRRIVSGVVEEFATQLEGDYPGFTTRRAEPCRDRGVGATDSPAAR